ncbi:SMP-30/gluconolactonase/LRE family protein [Sphingomonas sp.]|uniref:SMP-30/gluconolactonase/LRE family protein n=1 Tax=Sphingomonas sp. TaxID=28214 RepID=UPI0025E4ACF5|nr:SMP-30/gluconolactonase/LRE family protein [Sphingomonas sp.]
MIDQEFELATMTGTPGGGQPSQAQDAVRPHTIATHARFPVRTIERTYRDRLGEGLMWSPTQNSVYWTDILDRRLHRLDLATDEVRSWDMPDTIGWVLERRGGGLIAGLGRRIVSLALDPVRTTVLFDPEPDRDGNRMNDAKADLDGRLWAGTMPFNCDRPTGALYRCDPETGAERVDDGYVITNGPAFSPDGAWLYHTDSGLGTVYRFACDGGVLGPREPFIQFEPDWGKPDGMTCDSDGGLWIAHWGAGCVSRFTPEGTRELAIDLPASQITNCLFAGPNLDRLFVTSAHDGLDDPEAGKLFEIATGRRGLGACRYAG